MRPYLLVSGDFVYTGGMDRANCALAWYLAEQGYPTHLVAHRIAEELRVHPNVRWHRVRKVFDSYLVSTPLLEQVGRTWAGRIRKAGGRVLVNGGNCLARGAVNWAHYVHAVGEPPTSGGLLRRFKNRISHRLFAAMERTALGRAQLIVANSERTRQDLIERVRVPSERIRTVYYGIDAQRFRPATPAEKAAVRVQLAWPAETPFVAFLGALGDRRKGFDALFAAWEVLCRDAAWDAHLVVIGAGAELPHWMARAAELRLIDRMHFLGFRKDVHEILRACDALAAPTRYEAYGLGVQEALCCGLPALVSASAGVTERYPESLRDLLLPNPDDVTDLIERLRRWRQRQDEYRQAVAVLGEQLRAYRWDDMAARMVELMEAV